MTQGILGNVYHTPIKGDFEYLEQALIIIDNTGSISHVLNPQDVNYDEFIAHLTKNHALTRLADDQYLLPGMIDLHIHAPQWPQAGKGLDLPLDQWLMEYTFPLESRYSDLNFAQTVYPHLIDTYLSHGTTTGVYFATIDNAASEYLAKVCIEKGQRAFVGKVSMDEPSMCPDYYVEANHTESIANAEVFIQAIHNLPNNHKLVQPVITPRFIPTCSLEALKGLATLAKQYDCVIQTHASESDWARDFSREKYNKTDVEIYDEAGLLGRKTILAHSIFLTDNDVNIIKKRQSGIAHCPLSNMFFANAALPAREYLDAQVHMGLGSDVAASPYPSLFRSCFDGMAHSRTREDGTDTQLSKEARGVAGSRITLLESYWMGTVGGAQVLDIPAGQFKPGYYFDALCISTSQANSDITIYHEFDSPRDIFEKLIAYASSHNIIKTWVNGKLVQSRN